MREQVVGAVVEGDLLPGGRARLAEVRVPGEHADRVSVTAAPLAASRRTIGTARTRVGVSSNQSGEAESTICADSNASLTCVRHCGERARRRCRGRRASPRRRARVRHGDEASRRGRHPEHDVGEGEVGEQLAVAGEAVQPLDVGFAGAALGEHEVGESGHMKRLM